MDRKMEIFIWKKDEGNNFEKFIANLFLFLYTFQILELNWTF